MAQQIAFVVAMDEQRVIGYHNQLPWHLSADLRRFKAITMGKPIIMGSHTFTSIGKALPGRRNIVLSTRTDFVAPECDVVPSLDAALALVEDEKEIMIIGGARVYEQCLPRADKLYVTIIEHRFLGDTYFPAIDWTQWKIITEEQGTIDEKSPYPHRFIVAERISR